MVAKSVRVTLRLTIHPPDPKHGEAAVRLICRTQTGSSPSCGVSPCREMYMAGSHADSGRALIDMIRQLLFLSAFTVNSEGIGAQGGGCSKPEG